MSAGDIYRDASGVYISDEDGMGFRVDGSKKVNRDPSKSFNWWGSHPKREPPLVPLGKNWCSCHEHEGFDESGMDDGGWRPNEEFTEYIDAGGKVRKHLHCKTCRSRHARKLYASAKEAAGVPVRGYKRQLIQMSDGG